MLVPESQIYYARKLAEIRDKYFQERLRLAVSQIPVSILDSEIHEFVDAGSVSILAQYSLRGEAFFALPSILRVEPFLLGYYRLLYGVSQKIFYGSAYSRFKSMELKGVIAPKVVNEIGQLCSELARTGELLLISVSTSSGVTSQLLNDLQMMAAGVMFDGSKRNVIGQDGVRELMQFIKGIVPPVDVITWSDSIGTIRNASGRRVTITMSADPDVSILEHVEDQTQTLLAIEVKAGSDASNRLNRLGEAEKSHLKARQRGHTRCWTVVRVPYTKEEVALNSPATQEFWHLDEILDPTSEEHKRFVRMFRSYLGLS